MLIISDMGTDAVNSEAAFVFSLGANPKDGTTVLLAYGPGVNTILAAVGDRPERALEFIIKGHKEHWKLCDLRDLLGKRPDITVPQPKIVLPGNGEGRPS